MIQLEQTKKTFFRLVNQYPSPHNGQPITLRMTDQSSFELFFDKARGLHSAEISYIFSFVSMGVFGEHLLQCAQALGHKASIIYTLPAEEELKGTGQVLFARCHIEWHTTSTDPRLADALQNRQTSRKKYFKGVSSDVSKSITKLAAGNKMKLEQLSSDQARQTIWLNQRAVFDDMFDEPVRKELHHWLRYNQQQKQATRDGLAYDCMELNGRVLRYIVDHHKILRLPLLSWLLKQYYLRTMNDNSSVFYMMTPFKTPRDACNVGITIMKIWIQCTLENYYIHPFGTIVSNGTAHHDFLRLVGVTNETRDSSYVSFIFRAGESKSPTPSLRMPAEEHLIQE